MNYYHNDRLTDRLTLRTGVAWDQTPMPNPELRSPRVPGNDRTRVSIGGSYKINEHMSADVGYAHLFVDSTQINRTSAETGRLAGTYESDADIFSVQFNYVFH
jgi:long-chain fatty acid transport protein